jgi:hypothetical protein
LGLLERKLVTLHEASEDVADALGAER